MVQKTTIGKSLILSILLLPIGNAAAQPAQTVSPNIVLILTDDQRWDTLSYMPTVQAELVEKGIMFTNAYVTTAICCPSRASILTGLYAHNHGVLRNFSPNGGAVFFRDSSTLATWLQNAGYKTALVGKYLNEYHKLSPYIPPGWDDWRAFVAEKYEDYDLNENGTLVHYGTAEGDYSTDVLASKAAEFIKTSQGGPFFLYFNPFAPHRPATPAPRHVDLYATLSPWNTPSYNETDVSDKPQWVQDLELIGPTTQRIIEEERQNHLESLQAVDEAVAAILLALREIGQLEKTVIIFTSDNGLAWGEHRMDLTKGCGYEECLRVPMVVRYDGLTGVPREEDRFVLNIDLAPTFAELAGATLPSPVDGRSFAPLLEGSATDWRVDLLFEYWLDQEESGAYSRIPEYTGVRMAGWKYVEYVTGEKELYDEMTDPYELTNLSGDPAYATVETELAQRLPELRAGQADPSPLPTGGSGDDKKGPCLIATAAYGSPLAPHVRLLRDFRDRYLLPTGWGRGFVRAYERYSPPIAGWIERHESLRAVVRAGLWPLVGLAWWSLKTTVWMKMASFALFAALVGIVIWMHQKRRVVL